MRPLQSCAKIKFLQLLNYVAQLSILAAIDPQPQSSVPPLVYIVTYTARDECAHKPKPASPCRMITLVYSPIILLAQEQEHYKQTISHSTREKEAFPSSVMTNWLTSSMDNKIDHTNQTWHGSSAAAPLKKSRWCLFLSRLRNFALHSYPSNRQTGSGTSWTPKIVDRKRVCQSSNRATSILFSFCYSTPQFISSSPSWMTTEQHIRP